MDAEAPDRAGLLALVRSSPRYVAVHDKAGWIGIFAEHHVIEDPVGSRPVVGGTAAGAQRAASISRFWDTFIAPNDIVFEVDHDWVDGWDVVRDVTVVTDLPAGVRVRTPAHLRYETVLEAGELKVRRMAAHWEPVAALAQLLHPTRTHVRAGLGQGAQMLRGLGAGGTFAFATAAKGVGAKGKRQVLDLVAAAASGEPTALQRLGGVRPEGLHKVIASGDVVTAGCLVEGRPAAVLANLDRRTRQIRSVRVYTDLA